MRPRRILLKLGGESFQGTAGAGLDLSAVRAAAREIGRAARRRIQLAVVVGGGNIFRGGRGPGTEVERATADAMGMLATVINALALEDALGGLGVPARTLSAVEMPRITESYVRRRALKHLEKGRVILLGGGTGSPYVTTDTAAALRAAELGVDLLLKGTKVDGVYSGDPLVDPGARRYRRLGYRDVLSQGLGVMDAAAVSLCMENRIPIVVFRWGVPGILNRILSGSLIGTRIGSPRDPRGSADRRPRRHRGR